MSILPLLTIVPVLFYLVDAYHENDTKKGLLYIAAFALFAVIGISMLFLIGWAFALWTPILLVLMLSLKPRKKFKKTS
ncbi:hypothetical protein FEE95_10400 [Maribacter algarum]|uniref:Uncharacterized protein n=1 Tax=Maribacter algarum (ex Zhang et al. 2020) TaxID=2578118 RepID=A0A5S3PQJ5_9FLAO|nr:hypothetical protein [Maribacter algarum]TMM56899.1 hypothetical protein FEE95_10400 [Maribacter algarum]